MVKRRKRTTKHIPLTIGQDPTLWRYASLQDALAANCAVIAQLIQAGQRLQIEQGDLRPAEDRDAFSATGD